ncbi:hypothetical protein Bca4012_008344 [Brassica carinata]
MIPDGSFHESPKKKTNLSSSPIVSKEHLSRLFTVLIRLSFLSINRFEKKKNIDLAVSAFAILCKHKLTLSDDVTLTVAGGYDERLKENVEYLEELKSLAEKEGVSNRVSFITSCSTAERNELLSSCFCVLYTPTDEHFGIVPLGAMAAYKPVIACNSGGPVETVKSGVTGYLCEPNPEDFSSAMAKFVEDPELARGHVVESFVWREVESVSS